MKRYSLLLIVSLMLIIISTSASYAIFPIKPDGKTTLSLQQGWVDCKPAWYICTDTNDYRTACSQFIFPGQTLNLAPKLSSLLQRSTRDVFLVTNPLCSAGLQPVFDLPPGEGGYTGKWRVVLITFKPGVKPWLVCSANPQNPNNPGGRPTPNKAVYTETNIVVDYAIIGIGPLGGIGQTFDLFVKSTKINYRNKTVTLPYYLAYCQNPLTKKCMTAVFIVTAADRKSIAERLGVIFAPRLNGVDKDNIMEAWDFGDFDDPPATQYPVLQACPIPLGCRNWNFDYSPVIEFNEIDREEVPPCTVFCNPGQIERLLDNDVIKEEPSERFRIEGSVIGYL